MAKELSKGELRRKFGTSGKAIPATRVLVMPLDHFVDKGIDGKALMAINDLEGTVTSANVYDGNLGKNYDAEGMTHNLPDAKSDKWKAWKKKGYLPGKVEDFDVLELIEETEVIPETETSEVETETETEVEVEETADSEK